MTAPTTARPGKKKPATPPPTPRRPTLTPAGLAVTQSLAESLGPLVDQLRHLSLSFAAAVDGLSPADADLLASLRSDVTGIHVAAAGRLDALRSLIKRSGAAQPKEATS